MAASYGGRGRGDFFPRRWKFLGCLRWLMWFQTLCKLTNMVLDCTVSISARTPLYSSDVTAILKFYCSSRRLKLYTGRRWSSNQIAAGHSRTQTDATQGLECDCFITSDKLWQVASTSMQRIVLRFSIEIREIAELCGRIWLLLSDWELLSSDAMVAPQAPYRTKKCTQFTFGTFPSLHLLPSHPPHPPTLPRDTLTYTHSHTHTQSETSQKLQARNTKHQ